MLAKQKWNKMTGRRIFSMLLGTLGASLLGKLLTGKGTFRAGEGTTSAGQNIYCRLTHSLILK